MIAGWEKDATSELAQAMQRTVEKIHAIEAGE
jgi:hypothetical protein